MAIMKSPILVAALASVVAAQSSSVLDVFFPGAEGQSFIGSVVTSDASQTTLAVGCPTGTSGDADSDCAFDVPVTVTVGPSTFHVQEEFEGITAIIECSLDGSSQATCGETYIGPVSLIASDLDVSLDSDPATDTSILTTSTTTVLTGTDIAVIPITLVDDLEGAAETGAGATASTASATSGTTAQTSASTGATAATTGATQTTSGSSTATTSGSAGAATTSASGNGAGRADVGLWSFTAAGAGLLGVAALLL